MASWQIAFPKTIETLNRQGLVHYVQGFEFELESLHLSLDLRWFPVFLKMQNCPRRLLALAEFEYLRAQVYASDFGRPKLETGIFSLNPSAQFIEVQDQLPEIGRGPGLYCLVKSNSRFFEMELSLAQALLLDLLKEDRKFTKVQLFEMANLHDVKLGLSVAQWEETLASLVDRGVVLVGDEKLLPQEA